MTIKRILYTLLFLTLVSCTHVHNEIRNLMGKHVRIPIDEMICWNSGTSSVVKQGDAIKEYTYVVYLDSAICSSCNIKEFGLWNDLIDKMPNAQFVFIVAPHHKEDVTYIPLYLEKSGIESRVYIDDKYKFAEVNPFFPESYIYHTVLLDKNNRIILVGSPLRNPKLEKLAMSIVNDDSVKVATQMPCP